MKRNIKYIVFDLEGTLVETSFREIKCLPEIPHLLHGLAQSASLYLWTMRDRKSSLQILKETQLISYFDDFCCLGSDPFAYKPSPEGILHMLPPLGEFRPEEVLVVGDSVKDMQAGLEMKAYTFMAGWYQGVDLTTKEHLRSLGVSQVWSELPSSEHFLHPA